MATLTETNASHVPEVKSEKTEYVLVVSSLSNNSSLSPVLSEAKELIYSLYKIGERSILWKKVVFAGN